MGFTGFPPPLLIFKDEIMVQLPERTTVQLIKETIEKNQQRQKRSYIGASSIGDECSRKIWYAYNGYEQELMEWKVLCAIEDGHRTEALMAKRLRDAGIELYTEREDGKQFGFNYNEFFRGHYDGVGRGFLEAPNTWHVWECKAKNEKYYNELLKLIDIHGEKEALKNWNYIYYCQAVLYMHFEKLTRHYMTVAKAGGRDFIGIRTEENPKLAKALISKAERVHKAKDPPERAFSGKDFYKCKWCDFRNECWK